MVDSLKASIRKEFGKGVSRRLRQQDKIPGVLYGHGEDPLHLVFDYHETFMAIRGNANTLLSIEADGESHLALLKDVQRNPLSRLVEHVDFLRVKKGEKVEVEVQVVVEGEPAGDAIATLELQQILAMASATNIPESFVVSVEGREEGEHITIADMNLPEDVDVELDPETVVVQIAVPTVDIPEDEETEEAAEGEEAAGEEKPAEDAE